MHFIDFFSGIGGFRLGLESAGHKCVGHCEIDKYANKSYVAMHNPREDEWFAEDIRRVQSNELPEAEIYCGGFPCQSFSIAGKRRGFEDTRGTLFFEVMRLARDRKPKFIFLENVRGLLSHDSGQTFTTILKTFWECGYNVQWGLLNSKNFGVPQNRQRVYIIGSIREERVRKIFPISGTNTKVIKKLVDGYQGMRVYDIDGISSSLTSGSGGLGGKTGLYFIDLTKGQFKTTDEARCITSRYNAGVSNRKGESSGVLEVRACLTPGRLNKRQNGRRFKEVEEPMFTLTSQDRQGVLISEATKRGYAIANEGDSINLAVPGSKTRRGRVGKDISNTLDTSCHQGTLVNGRIRKLTPKECFRLQGFSDEYFERAQKVNSDNQLYKQAGNAVTVNVIYEIAKRLN